MAPTENTVLNWRGYPVTVISDGALAALGGPGHEGELPRFLRRAVDIAKPGEPSDWRFEMYVNGRNVWVERFGGIRETDRHPGGQWSVYLPEER